MLKDIGREPEVAYHANLMLKKLDDDGNKALGILEMIRFCDPGIFTVRVPQPSSNLHPTLVICAVGTNVGNESSPGPTPTWLHPSPAQPNPRYPTLPNTTLPYVRPLLKTLRLIKLTRTGASREVRS